MHKNTCTLKSLQSHLPQLPFSATGGHTRISKENGAWPLKCLLNSVLFTIELFNKHIYVVGRDNCICHLSDGHLMWVMEKPSHSSGEMEEGPAQPVRSYKVR